MADATPHSSSAPTILLNVADNVTRPPHVPVLRVSKLPRAVLFQQYFTPYPNAVKNPTTEPTLLDRWQWRQTREGTVAYSMKEKHPFVLHISPAVLVDHPVVRKLTTSQMTHCSFRIAEGSFGSLDAVYDHSDAEPLIAKEINAYDVFDRVDDDDDNAPEKASPITPPDPPEAHDEGFSYLALREATHLAFLNYASQSMQRLFSLDAAHSRAKHLLWQTTHEQCFIMTTKHYPLSLDDIIRSLPKKRYPGGSVAHFFLLAERLFRCLVVAHDQGIVHRDIKPANIFCGPAPFIDAVIGDWGSSRWLNDSTPEWHLWRESIGVRDYSRPGSKLAASHITFHRPTPMLLTNPITTITYSPPEHLVAPYIQYCAKGDVWALGCVLVDYLFQQLQCVALGSGCPPPLSRTTTSATATAAVATTTTGEKHNSESNGDLRKRPTAMTATKKKDPFSYDNILNNVIQFLDMPDAQWKASMAATIPETNVVAQQFAIAFLRHVLHPQPSQRLSARHAYAMLEAFLLQQKWITPTAGWIQWKYIVVTPKPMANLNLPHTDLARRWIISQRLQEWKAMGIALFGKGFWRKVLATFYTSMWKHAFAAPSIELVENVVAHLLALSLAIWCQTNRGELAPIDHYRRCSCAQDGEIVGKGDDKMIIDNDDDAPRHNTSFRKVLSFRRLENKWCIALTTLLKYWNMDTTFHILFRAVDKFAGTNHHPRHRFSEPWYVVGMEEKNLPDIPLHLLPILVQMYSQK